MPRNYSVKQTIEMLKQGEAVTMGKGNKQFTYPIKEKKVEDKAKHEPTAQKTVDNKVESADNIIRFDPPKEDNKKWYQFWK